MGTIDPGADFQAVVDAYADEIRRCRYGSFRGVIKNGKIVVFALEHEWRPQLEERPPEEEARARPSG